MTRSTFPHREPITVGELVLTPGQVVELLHDHVSDRRRQRIDRVISERVFSVIPVLDGLYDRGNVSAVMRTAEGLGFGELHVIESPVEEFKAANRVTQGAEKWLDVRTWHSPAQCLENLQTRGFQVVATSLEAAVPLDAVDFGRPTALVFGNERDGVCGEVLEACDLRVVLPMRGFAQSFNISVAAALTLYHALRAGVGPDLDESQREILRANYYLRSVEHHEAILARALRGGSE